MSRLIYIIFLLALLGLFIFGAWGLANVKSYQVNGVGSLEDFARDKAALEPYHPIAAYYEGNRFTYQIETTKVPPDTFKYVMSNPWWVWAITIVSGILSFFMIVGFFVFDSWWSDWYYQLAYPDPREKSLLFDSIKFLF
jgi:hypothetical protein